MLWIVIGVAVVLFLVWMWRIDRRDTGSSRLGWGGKANHRVNNHGLLGDSGGGMNANDQLSYDAFAADDAQSERRFWQRGSGSSS